MKSLAGLAVVAILALAGTSEAAGARAPRGVQVVDGGIIKGRRRVPAVTIEVRKLDPKKPPEALHKSAVAKIAAALYRAPF